MSRQKKRFRKFVMMNVFVIGAMYTINRVISSSSIIKNLLNPSVGNIFDWKFGSVYYRKFGIGKPLLLIHDLNCNSSGFEWNQLEIKLSRNHTVYTIDLPGCGRSVKPGITYTNYLYVQLISEFIRRVIGEKPDIVATGLSSSFVTMTAYSDPDLIDKIIMINPSHLKKLDQIPNERSKIIRSIMNIPVIGTFIYHIATNRQNIEYILTEKIFFNPFRVQQKFVDGYYEASHRGHGGGKYLMTSLDGRYLNVNIRRALSEIENDIFILYGSKQENGREVAEDYQKINHSISILSIPTAKYLPQLESPEETLSTIENILG